MNAFEYRELLPARTAEIDACGNYRRIDVSYLVRGAATEDDALKLLLPAVPKKVGELPLDGISIAERISEDDGSWKLTVAYQNENGAAASAVIDDDDELEFGFDSAGTTRHVTVANRQKRVYGTMEAGKLVNWNGLSGRDSQVTGVDVPSAEGRIWFAKTMRAASISTAKMKVWMGMYGVGNLLKWRGWEAGELLFLGATFGGKVSGDVKVTFNFSVRPNEIVTFGSNQYKVQGWEYLWVHTKTAPNASGVPVPKITDIYIAGVVKYKDFSLLGI